jgi:hypothetical protein
MKKSQVSYGGVATIVAILVVVVCMITPVSASTCHPGFVTITPSSSWQYTQPSFSSIIATSPALNQGSTIQFSRPSFSSTAPDFITSGKGYISFNPFRW